MMASLTSRVHQLFFVVACVWVFPLTSACNFEGGSGAVPTPDDDPDAGPSDVDVPRRHAVMA